MNVGQLIKELEKYPKDSDVKFYSSELGGYTQVTCVTYDETMDDCVELNDEE